MAQQQHDEGLNGKTLTTTIMPEPQSQKIIGVNYMNQYINSNGPQWEKIIKKCIQFPVF